jgi:hypothetical protein
VKSDEKMMKANAQFYSLLTGLLKSAGLDHTGLHENQNDSYTLGIQGVEIEFVGSQEGFINMFSFLDKVPTTSSEMMKEIVLANRFQEAHPPINISIVEEERIQLVLWTRMPLKNAEDTALIELLVRFIQSVGSAERWLADGAPCLTSALNSSKRSAAPDEYHHGARQPSPRIPIFNPFSFPARR